MKEYFKHEDFIVYYFTRGYPNEDGSMNHKIFKKLKDAKLWFVEQIDGNSSYCPLFIYGNYSQTFYSAKEIKFALDKEFKICTVKKGHSFCQKYEYHYAGDGVNIDVPIGNIHCKYCKYEPEGEELEKIKEEDLQSYENNEPRIIDSICIGDYSLG